MTVSPSGTAEDLVHTALAKAYAAWWRVRGASDLAQRLALLAALAELGDLDRAVVVLR